VFDRLYNTFPASTRAHVSIATGGSTLTWGSVSDELLHRYAGQTLVSAFKADRRPTGLFSAGGFNFENLNRFYEGLGFDYIFNPDTELNKEMEKHRVHTWGLDERVIADLAYKWALEQNKPFFLQFMTTTSHYPYGTPKDFSAPFTGEKLIDKYRNSVFFVDSVIRQFVSRLENAGIAEDTILIIAGDHGEAFGDLHSGNILHRNFLYEENIRNFAMIIDLAGHIEPVSSSRSGSIGDIMPTVLAIQGIDPDGDLLGQNLLDENYQLRMHFFFKSTVPAQWGLVDGNWKFIARQSGGKYSEIYDLNSDPDEKHNLVADHPEKVAAYRMRVRNWYIFANNEFALKLDGFFDDRRRPAIASALVLTGPREIRIGRKPAGLPFEEHSGIFHPEETITVQTRGAPFGDDTLLRYVYTSPTGDKKEVAFIHRAEWTTAYFADAIETPREPGLWRIEIYNGDRRVIAGEFRIDSSAPLFWSRLDHKPGIRNVILGGMKKMDRFKPAKIIRPDADLAALLQIEPFGADQTIELEWIAPNGRRYTDRRSIAKGWNSLISRFPGKQPPESGKWKLKVWLGRLLQASQDFQVSNEVSR
jgi:hypothetical protein